MTAKRATVVCRFLSMLIVAAVGVSCGSATVETQPTPSATVTQAPTAIPTDTPVPTPTQTPFVPKANVKIVVHVPLSGNWAAFGTDMTHAAELAVRQLAGPLHELGYKIELVSYDDAGEVATAAGNAREFVSDPEVLCGVGNFTSAITLQASEIYHRAGLAFVSPSATNPEVTGRGYPEINRVAGRDDVEGVAGARFAKAQGFASVFLISSSNEFAARTAAAFKREAGSLGITVFGNVTTDQPKGFDSLIAKVLASNAEAVYFAGFPDQAGEFFREARAANFGGLFLGNSALDNPDLLTFAGPLLVDGGGTYYTEQAALTGADPQAASFFQDFELLYGTVPGLFAPQAYDAAGICLKAIQEASIAKSGDLPTRQEVAGAIRSLKNYPGIAGTYTFNKNGDPELSRYVVFKVLSLDPKQWGQSTPVATFELPPPD